MKNKGIRQLGILFIIFLVVQALNQEFRKSSLIQNRMENIILKNQKELNQNLPAAQLGSKFTKLTNRFACKPNYPFQAKLPLKNVSSHQSILGNITNQNPNGRKISHKRVQSSFQGSQLQYFKQINSQIKHQNQNLKEDLKICNEKMNKILEEKKRSEEKLIVCQKTLNQSQKKISSLMQLAHHLIIMVKDKYFVSENPTSNGSQNCVNTLDGCISPLQSKKLSMQKQMQKIQQLTRNKRSPLNQKKKTIQSMMQQYKLQQEKSRNCNESKKSNFYQNSYKTRHQKQSKTESVTDLQQQDVQADSQMNELMNSIESFQKEAKELKVLQKLMEGISNTFSQKNNRQKLQKNIFDDNAKNMVLQKLGTFFTDLIQNHGITLHSKCTIEHQVLNQKIKPAYTSYRLYASIKQIFDHQIYLLQNQKMLFLQFKNKRLLKFIYECSGCERYQEMFNQIFRILREGFKQIKCKIMPELRNRQDDDLQILL